MTVTTTILPFNGARPYRLSAGHYLTASEAGAFGDAHVELVDGELIETSPSQSEHGRLLMLVGRLLGNAYEGTDFVLYGDIITVLDESNVRAPDIAVVDRDIEGRKELVPADIVLAVEIAGSTLSFDIGRKRIDYASARIRHYWVVDLAARRVHCYADPQGADYAAIQVFAFGDPVPVPATATSITIG